MSELPAYILGQAQRSYHDVAAVEHPLKLMIDIAREALADAGIAASAVEAIGCVDPFSWTYEDLTAQVANGLDCDADVRAFWLPAGGTTPQDLLHEVAGAMANGELDVALLVGAEAMRTRRKATRAGQTLPWPPRDKNVKPMRGQQPFTSEWEARHGLRLPIQSFPLHENALRTANGRSAAEQIELAAQLLHKNALVAAANPNAWFQDAPTAATIATVTDDNRLIAYPYNKRMNAIMDVDQAAAVVVVSHRFLAQHGGFERAAAILGGAGAEEVWNPIQRRSLAASPAMRVAFSHALSSAGVTVDDVHAFDFYSCFPAPIQMALAALAMSVDDPRPFSLTGGLAYAGGPGNNYVMHSLCAATTRIREQPEQLVMVTGVGMANTKHAATLLGNAARVPTQATGRTAYRLPTGERALPVVERASGDATVVSYTIEYDRAGTATNVIYILDLAEGSLTTAEGSLTAAEGSLPGTAEGSLPGTAEGSLPGTAEGSLPGTAEGSLPGTAEGSLPGTAEGSLPGTAEGSLPGTAEGSLSRTAEGSLSGTAEGSLPSPAEGSLPAAEGSRAIANAETPQAVVDELLATDPIGRHGRLRWDSKAERQFFDLA